MPENKFPEHIAIIGGGRWARVIAQGVCTQVAEGTQLSLCSPGNPAGWAKWVDSNPETEILSIRFPGLDEVLADPSVEICLIARNASNHAKTVVDCLRAGKRVYVEKPFATSSAEAKAVTDLAGEEDCWAGLVFLYHPGIQKFAKVLGTFPDLEHMDISWTDPAQEIRGGEAKSFDADLNIVLDVFPHIWSMLRLFEPDCQIVPTVGELSENGNSALLKCRLGSITVSVSMARNADKRARTINAVSGNHAISLDFSEEPGMLFLDREEIPIEHGSLRPMALQLKDVLSGNFTTKSASLCNVHKAQEAITIAEKFLMFSSQR